jgi:hypothetical protein
MSTSAQIVHLLNSRAVQQIRFNAESIRIDSKVYRDLSALVNSGDICILVSGSLPKGVDAQYDNDKNRLEVPSAAFSTLFEKQVIVHEMTHAAIDMMGLTKSRGLHRTENEGIAYIAEWLFVHNSGGARAAKSDLRFCRVADRIVQEIVKAQPHVYTVSAAEMRELRNAVGQDPGYNKMRGKIDITDGIKKRVTRNQCQ